MSPVQPDGGTLCYSWSWRRETGKPLQVNSMAKISEGNLRFPGSPRSKDVITGMASFRIMVPPWGCSHRPVLSTQVKVNSRTLCRKSQKTVMWLQRAWLRLYCKAQGLPSGEPVVWVPAAWRQRFVLHRSTDTCTSCFQRWAASWKTILINIT